MHQANALRFGLRKHRSESPKSFLVRVANGDGFAFFFSPVNRQFQLSANGSLVLNIIEERDIAECRAHAALLCGFVSYGGGGGSAVDKKELARAKIRHE